MNYSLYRIKSIERALHTLQLFDGNRTKISLGELSEELGVHKSTAYRIAVTLTEEGFLRWDNRSGTYRLGLKILGLGANLIQNMELRSQARPHLKKLHEDLGETVNLGVLDDGEVVYIDKIEGKRSIKLYSEVGKRAPCHCTALGKALLSGASRKEIKAIVEKKGLKRFTPNTIVTTNDFLEHLEEVKNKGYAVDQEEHEPLVYCVAAPIRDYSGKITAALSTTSIMKDFEENILRRNIEATVTVGRTVSAEMGYLKKIGDRK